MRTIVRTGSDTGKLGLLAAVPFVLALGASASVAAAGQATAVGAPAPVAAGAEGIVVASAASPAAAGDGQTATGAGTGQTGQAQADAAMKGEAAQATRSAGEDFTWSWGATFTYGPGFRLRDPDPRLIGVAAGGQAFSVNADDGNQNYGRGIFSNAAKLTGELQFSYRNFGAFFRGFGFYDYENEHGERARTPLTNAAKRRVGARAEIRDAFGYYRFRAGGQQHEIRGGWQVINWGESTFIQGGLNAINPLDVSVLRVPGAELRDALLPVGAVKVSLKPSTSTNFEAYYQYSWEDLKIDPAGSYFSTSDIAGAGSRKVMLGFGSVPDTVPVGHPPLPPAFSPVGTAVPRLYSGDDPFEDEPRQGGQYGAAFRVFADQLAGTEFGFYFINYHSRLPLIMARTGTQAGLLGGNYAATAHYYFTFPENIKLFGASFNTQLGRTGIAMQGELSHRRDLPLQIDDVEILYAALSPLRLLPPVPQLAPIIQVGTLLAGTNQVGAFGFSDLIQGYRRFNTTQVQVTGTKAFSRILGADQVVLVGEAAWGRVHDMPSKDVLRLEGPATFTSGNPVHQQFGVQPGTEPLDAFPTQNAFGYILAGRFEFNNAIGPVNMVPRFSFAQDVSGISPGPAGNFLEGRKALTLGLGFQYRIKWEFDVSYTSFFGAGRYNLLNDRDFVAATIKYTF
jgi:hypothetical protein